MNSKYQILSQQELKGILENRTSTDYSVLPKRLTSKEISDEVVMQKSLLRFPGTYIQPLTFDGCIFNTLIDIGKYESAGKINFHDCIFNGMIKVHIENSSFSGICVFNCDLTIYVAKESEISNYNVNGNFVLIGSSSNLILKNINQGQEINGQFIKIKGEFSELILENISGKVLEFSSKLEIKENLIIKNISIIELLIGMISLAKNMEMYNCKIGNLKFKNVTGVIKGLNIFDSTIEKMEFQISALASTSIIGGTINTLRLFNINQENSIINIEKTTVFNLKFERIFNNGLLTLRELNIPKKGLVSFKSSNLGKADFIYCDFSEASLEFENSKITEAFFSETEFPKKVIVNGKTNYGQAQLTFGQLATAFLKQGDNIRALEYNSRELEAHYKKIKLFSSYFFQKINLWLNFISNNFGRNWIRGVIFSFSVGLLFFCSLLVSTNLYRWGFPRFEKELLPAYLKFMNPLRFFELETLFNNTSKEGIIKLNELSYLSDFTGRVFIAYGYYQTIQAFRRFGRK